MSAPKRRAKNAPVAAVLDTGLVLNALVHNEGPAALLRQAWQAGRLTPLLSAATATELLAALAYRKLRLKPEEQEELLGDFLPYARAVQAVPAGASPLLQLARVSPTAQLVSDDARLIASARKKGLQAVKLQALLGGLAPVF